MGAEKLFKHTYRFRGRIDFETLYKKGKGFWLGIVDPDDFAETKYKDKGKEFEVKWTITHNYDAYHQLVYGVEFKASNMKPVTIKVGGKEKKVFDGMIRFYVESTLVSNYAVGGPGGNKEIFRENSILHKLFKRLTTREREEDLEGVGIVVSQEYLDLMRDICKAHARY